MICFEKNEFNNALNIIMDPANPAYDHIRIVADYIVQYHCWQKYCDNNCNHYCELCKNSYCDEHVSNHLRTTKCDKCNKLYCDESIICAIGYDFKHNL